MMKLLKVLLLTAATAGIFALVWKMAASGGPGSAGPLREAGPDALTEEEKELLMQELASQL